MPYQCRSRLLRGLAILLCACSVTLPAAAQQPTKPQAAAGRKTVCVASAIGQQFELKTIGLMVFGNDRKSATVGSWGIDGLVVQRLGAGLGAGFSVRPITLPAGALAGYAAGQGLFSGGRDDALKSAIRNSAKAGCAYYVIATTFSGQFPGTNQAITGIGIVKRDAIIKAYLVYAVFAVRVYDGHTAELIRQPIDGGDILAAALTTPSWMQSVDETYWPDNPQATAQHTKLRDTTRSLVAKLVNNNAQRIRAALTRPD